MNSKIHITEDDVAKAIQSLDLMPTEELTAAVSVRLRESLTGELVYRTFNKLRLEKKRRERDRKKNPPEPTE